MIKEIELNLLPEDFVNAEALKLVVAKQIRINPKDILEIKTLRRSIDARKNPITYRTKLLITTFSKEEKNKEEKNKEEKKDSEDFKARYKDVSNSSQEVIVIGSGPAGLFASLKLIERGIKPIILERGGEVSQRKKDTALIVRNREINSESNWCFGEGGAGTFSDGKLYTRSNKRGNITEILETFVFHGADENIMIEAHPHIGTDRLSRIIKNIRQTIEEFGGKYYFNTKVVDILSSNNKIQGVITENGERIDAKNIILATGHSARDIYYMFRKKGWAIEAKPFAMGVRVEHPQELINQIQYHSKNYSPLLPEASYKLVYSDTERGVFSFCMCPGGVIVPAGSDKGELVVNGMSNSARGSGFANSGIVVSVGLKDVKNSENNSFALLDFQIREEKKMFEITKGTLKAPAQRLTDFLCKKASSSLSPSSYLCGVEPMDMNKILPKFISQSLHAGFCDFGKKMKGFISSEANIIGLESRSSSPIRIPRNKDSYEHIQISGLYPCGEGVGYAGGITSSAIDGINIAEAIKP